MKEILRDLASKRDRLLKISMAYFALMVLAVVVIFVGPGLIGMALGAALLLFYFGWLRVQLQGYSDDVGKANILKGLATPLKDAAYLGSAGLTAQELEQKAMLPIQADDRGLLLRQGFEGKRDGGTCRGWEVTFHYQRGAKKTDCAFLSGTLLTKDFDTAVSGMPEWLAIQKDLVDEGVLRNFLMEKGYAPVSAGNAAFDQNYVLGVREGGILPEKILARLAGLCGKLNRLGAVHCTAEEVALFLDRRFYTERVKIKNLPTEEQLRTNPLPERDDIWDFFVFLQKWKAGEA